MTAQSTELLGALPTKVVVVEEVQGSRSSCGCGSTLGGRLLRGEKTCKLRWSSRVAPKHHAILGREPLSWSHYAAYHVLRSRVKKYAYSEDAPAWVKVAEADDRTRRYATARYASKGKRL
jgi:hypothetical protein